MNERAMEIKRRFEVPILVAALLVVPVILVEEQVSASPWPQVAMILNWLIWASFAAEFVAMMRVVDDRAAYARSAWLDIIIIVVSFPLLPVLLGATRLVRLLRLGRALRLVAILGRGGLAANFLFKKGRVGHIALLTALLAVGAGGLFMLIEPQEKTAGDAIWWAFVTLTTVGYGDITPASAGGRMVGVILMFLGIGFVALLTGAVAARFVEHEESTVSTELENLNQRLERIEALLTNPNRNG